LNKKGGKGAFKARKKKGKRQGNVSFLPHKQGLGIKGWNRTTGLGKGQGMGPWEIVQAYIDKSVNSERIGFSFMKSDGKKK